MPPSTISGICLDLETNADRVDTAEHEIIEIGALKVIEGHIVETIDRLVAPTRPLSQQTIDVTGIQPKDLEGAMELDKALAELIDFAGDAPVIAHNGLDYDFVVLDAACDRLGIDRLSGTRLDTLELAHLVFPRVGERIPTSLDGGTTPLNRTLQELASHLGVNIPDQLHRALVDAELCLGVAFRLLEELNAPKPVRELQRLLLHSGSHPWSLRLKAGPTSVSLLHVVPGVGVHPKAAGHGRFNKQAAAQLLSAGGALVQPPRRPRSQQVEMATLVSEAFADKAHHMIEAPTGTGKTLGYLVPSILWARAAGEPVAISTHTKVLQNQVIAELEDIPAPVGPVRWSMLKGRNNYLHLESLASEIESPIQDADHAFALALLVGWVGQTPTGDWDDLRAWWVSQRSSWLDRLTWQLRVEDLPGAALSPLDELCFYRRALRGASLAEITVVNHAVAVTNDDLQTELRYLVVDEAHTLEDAATSAFSDEVTEAALDHLVRAIWDPDHRRGTLARFVDATSSSFSDPQIDAVRSATSRVSSAAARFKERIIEYTRERGGIDRADLEHYGASYRIRRGVDTGRPAYQGVIRAGSELRLGLSDLTSALNTLIVREPLAPRYNKRRLEREIARSGRTARDFSALIQQVLGALDDEQWIPIVDISLADQETWSWSLRRVPLSVGAALAAIWDSIEAAVLTSATLRVGGDFSYHLGRLGFSGIRATALSSPFVNMRSNHLVVLTDHLPSPRGSLLDEFADAEGPEFVRIFTVTQGRGLGLFTSRRRMFSVRDHARPLLELDGIPLLAQGDGPAPALAERMRTEKRSSLLGVRSFWEGIDIPGEALSALVVEKIPFESPADPIVAARCEFLELQGHDPFGDYLVPRAAILFAQGVGRLIRAEDDRGVTVVLDSRLRRPVPYREQILGTLQGPPSIVRPGSAELSYRAIAEHLDIPFDDQLLAKLQQLGPEDMTARLQELALSTDDLADASIVRQRLEEVRELFGFSEWRAGQEEVMARFLAGEDVLAVLPTGHGKSITFQIPAVIGPGLTLVVSPLIALMRDQVQALRERGVQLVGAIHSGLSQGEQDEILRAAKAGRCKLLYVSPERLWSPRFRAALRTVTVARLAVDEAHCISQWGHSFRPEYIGIPEAIGSLIGGTRPPVLAVTATATQHVRNEIVELLNLSLSGAPIVLSPDRPEIHYYTERCEDIEDRDLRVVQVVEAFERQSAIVYVPRRKDTHRLSGLLRAAGHSVRPYHGAMPSEERLYVEDMFRHGEIDVVVATKAFGLGIDKPDIALIIHLEMPATVEEFVQESGRLARGALQGVGPATGTSVLMVTPRDCGIHKQFVRGAAPDLDRVRSVWGWLSPGHNYQSHRNLVSRIGGDSDSENVGLAIHYLVLDGALDRNADVSMEGSVFVPSDAGDLLDEVSDEELRRQGGAILDYLEQSGRSDYQALTWARGLEMSPEDVESALLQLADHDVLGFSVWDYGWHLERSEGREPDWEKIEEWALARRSVVQDLARTAREFSRVKESCRRNLILDYLDAPRVDVPCGGCDVCVPSLPRPWSGSELTAQQLHDAVPVELICLRLISDTSAYGYSESSLVRALMGEDQGRVPLHRALVEHQTFGRLSFLGRRGILALFDDLVRRGLAQRSSSVYETTTYTRITATAEGRSRVV